MGTLYIEKKLEDSNISTPMLQTLNPYMWNDDASNSKTKRQHNETD